MSNRVNIPSEIKRNIRKKCNYGCIICGCPICEIDHLTKEWHECHEHDENDMFLLCPTHHAEKTKGLLTKSKIMECFLSSKRKNTEPYKLNIEKCALILGNNLIETFPGTLFNILNKSYISAEIENDNYLFSGKVINKDGNTAFELNENEITFYSSIWDIEFAGKTIEFRNKLRDLFLKIIIDPNESRLTIYGNFQLDESKVISINKNGVFINNKMLISECKSINNINNIGFYIYDSREVKLNGCYGFNDCIENRNSGGNGFVWDYNKLKNV